MESSTLMDENWQVIVSLFPNNWRELAKEHGAVLRQLRSFSSEEAIIRTLLLHIGCGYSLRETVVKAKAAAIADVSDVALLKRLKCSEHWIKALCISLLAERGVKSEADSHGIRMRLVDGTHIKEPGQTGSLWRIHYSMQLPNLHCDYFKLTPTEGVDTGETYKQFPVQANDCIIGDRGYSTAAGIEHLHKRKAFALVRVNTGSLKFYTQTGEEVDLLSKVDHLKTAGQVNQWTVWVKKKKEGLIKGRVCAIRKSEYAIEQALKKIKQQSSKKQHTVRPETLKFAQYIIVFTTLPEQDFSASSVLEWYRLRWQIELIFKRLKSLAGLGHLPKYDDVSSRAWLYGKLLVGLLVEKLISQAGVFSPWGYKLEFK